jgi:ABC-type transport system involved in cytochrome bd biosynthesis fused ATPase/permease subunit
MIGIMIFFTIAVATTVFKVLPPEWASKYVRSFFPKYYAVLGVLSILAAFLASNALTSGLLIVCAVLFLFALWILTAAINKASDAKERKKFGVLHGLSVVINVVQLIIFVYLIWP